MKAAVIKSIAAAALALIMALALAACGEKEITLNVNDAGVLTEITAQTGQKVSEVLAKAEITLGDKDETEPSADTALTEDVTEITVKRYAKVTVVSGSDKKEVELVGGTVEDAVKKAGFTLGEGASMNADPKTYLTDGMTITISAGVKVSVTVDGKTTEATAAAGTTVKEFLDKQGVSLGKDDVCTEKLDSEVTDGMKITIKRVEYKEETKKETVDYETEETYDSSLASGESQVTQQGVEGEKEVTYKVKYVDGKEASREKASEKVTKKAVNQIIAYGTKEAAQEAPAAQGGSGSESSSGGEEQPAGRTVVSKTPVYNCDGSGHGYYEIVYSDGQTEYEEF